MLGNIIMVVIAICSALICIWQFGVTEVEYEYRPLWIAISMLVVVFSWWFLLDELLDWIKYRGLGLRP